MAISLHTGNVTTNQVAESVTFAYDSGSDANRVMVITTGNPGDPSAPTYNGVALTRRAETHANLAWKGIWSLDDPASGSNNVVIDGGVGWYVTSETMSFDGADTNGVANTATGTGANPSVTLTGVSDGSACIDSIQHNTTITVGAGQTELHNVVSTGTQNDGTSYLVKSGAGNQTMSWTAASALYDYAALEITAVAGGGAANHWLLMGV